MANDWKIFIVTTKYVTDLNGSVYEYQIPPTWKTELLLWEILENSPDVDVTNLASITDAFEAVTHAVAFVLQIPDREKIEDLFDGDSIERVFSDVWDSVSVIPDEVLKSAKEATNQKFTDDFSLSTALALFAAECGWTPDQVLSLPKVQVMSLVSSISDYVTQNMKFQAAIHGIPIEEPAGGSRSSSSSDSAQIDIEAQMMQFKAAGLPIEVI